MKVTKLLAVAGLGMLMLMVPRAKASEWNQKTEITFSQPVEVPGRVLPAGTYVFKLMDSDSDRNIVQVVNKRENTLYGTFLTIPDYHLQPADKTIVTFEERASGSPEAVRTWFYPGEEYGHDFVYPKARAVELARRTKQAVPSMPTELAANTTKPAKTMTESHIVAMKKAPIKAQKPTGEEVEIAEVFARPPQPVQTVAAAAPVHLPKTGSPLPLVGLIGIVSLAAGFSVRAVAVRRS